MRTETYVRVSNIYAQHKAYTPMNRQLTAHKQTETNALSPTHARRAHNKRADFGLTSNWLSVSDNRAERIFMVRTCDREWELWDQKLQHLQYIEGI